MPQRRASIAAQFVIAIYSVRNKLFSRISRHTPVKLFFALTNRNFSLFKDVRFCFCFFVFKFLKIKIKMFETLKWFSVIKMIPAK